MPKAVVLILNLARKVALATAGVAALLLAVGIATALSTRAQSPVAGAQSAAARPAFEVASVKPTLPGSRGSGGGPLNSQVTFSVHGMTLKLLIAMAYADTVYDTPDSQVSGGPAWTDADRFDIEAKAASPSTRGQMMQMLGALLTDRFQLVFHRETRTNPVYALVVAKGGPKLHAAKEGEPLPDRPSGGLALRRNMKQLAAVVTLYLKMQFPSSGELPLSEPEPLPVIDQTGLTGVYDIVLDLSKSRDWFMVLEQQLGLKLEARKVKVEMLVIDSAAKPTAN